MTDPYKVLGVAPNASDEQIKAAYRELIRKYHPDNYANNPLSDLASEKMKEINEAYDMIQEQRRNAGSSGSSSGSYTGGNSQFADIRHLINTGRINEAQELLDGVPKANRDAEWFFLRGSVFYSRGWLNEALTHFNTACQLNPNNPEYKAALNQMMWQRQHGSPDYSGGYRTNQQPTGGCSACDVCTGLYCADCCCECFGGDFIRCC